MFLRVALGWVSHGPKELDDLAFEFQKVTSGTSFQKPRLVSSCLNIKINRAIGESFRIINRYSIKKYILDAKDALELPPATIMDLEWQQVILISRKLSMMNLEML